MREFYDHFISANARGDALEAERLVQQNREAAQTLAQMLLTQANRSVQIGDYAAAIDSVATCRTFNRFLGETDRLGMLTEFMGLLHYKNTDHAQSAAYYKEALVFARQNADRDAEKRILKMVTQVLTESGEYNEALTISQQALRLIREDRDQVQEGTTLRDIALIYRSLNDLQNALTFSVEALQVFRNTGDKVMQSGMLNEIGELYRRTGQSQKSLDCFQEALALNEGGGNEETRIEGVILNNMGLVYADTGDFLKSLQYHQLALSRMKEAFDRNGEAITLNNLGEAYRRLGDPRSALSSYEESLAIRREIGDKAGEARTLNNIGLIHNWKGEYLKALGCFQDALQLHRENENRLDEGATLNNIGTNYRRIGDHQRALDYFADALQREIEVGNRVGVGRILDNIGQIYDARGDYREALRVYGQALKTRQEVGDKAGSATTLGNIAGVYDQIGNHREGRDYYMRALEIATEIGDRDGQGATLNNIGVNYFRDGEYELALSHFKKALDIRSEIGDREGEGQTLSNIADVYEKQGNLQEAVDWYKRAIDLLESLREGVGKSEGKESFLERNIKVYQRTVSLLLQLNRADEAFSYAERSKARAFLDSMYEASVGVKKGIDPELIAEESGLHARLSDVLNSLDAQPDPQVRAALLEERKNLDYRMSVLTQKIRAGNPQYAQLKYPIAVDIKQLQNETLREGEVLVQYLLGEQELFAFVVGKREFAAHRLALTTGLVDKILKLVGSLHEDEPPEFDFLLAHEVYNSIFQSLEESVTRAGGDGPVETLILVPDLVLSYLPFEMLVVESTQSDEPDKVEYLLNRYPITYAVSATALKVAIEEQREFRTYDTDLLAFAPFCEAEEVEILQVAKRAAGNVSHSEEMSNGIDDWDPLPYSAGEVKSICAHYKASDYKLGAEASKQFLITHTSGVRYLHLATHGYFDPVHPMYSGLLFADGMLQTYEILNMEIDAELAVLSACESGLGRLRAGEGLVGLARAFFYAGTPSLLVSLWSVADSSTALFMTRFYDNLNSGLDKCESVREAKQWLIKEGADVDELGNETRYSHPFYWAPFVLIGAS